MCIAFPVRMATNRTLFHTARMVSLTAKGKTRTS